jgi:crotonobetaine/carnitine-CoA ligase
MSDGIWISGKARTVVDLLDERLDRDPDGEYLDVCGAKVSAAEVASVAYRLAGSLAALGVGPGDRVATLIENTIEAALAWWGIVCSGAVAVPVNTAYKGEYLRHQLADSGARPVHPPDQPRAGRRHRPPRPRRGPPHRPPGDRPRRS